MSETIENIEVSEETEDMFDNILERFINLSSI